MVTARLVFVLALCNNRE